MRALRQRQRAAVNKIGAPDATSREESRRNPGLLVLLLDVPQNLEYARRQAVSSLDDAHSRISDTDSVSASSSKPGSSEPDSSTVFLRLKWVLIISIKLYMDLPSVFCALPYAAKVCPEPMNSHIAALF